ncbi:RagB/SusD family nutrient uptake outer membrane protein [Prolixibacter bellariivorans]|uniref:RagB/SusD family nutrient uptake outer membrane protein n=1 Tax=Prolixibacter bellariivorans TaxID=314319 RepID=UPI001F15E610|nr:RagB/SusD family nutrient uptake outer membrane protein [Prolixibacter bellariivorans]
MKMLKLIKYSAVLFLLGTIACTNLNENVLDEQLGVNLVNDSSNIVALIQPPYASLRHTIEWYDYWALQEVSTDEVIVPTRGSDWYDNGAWVQLHLQTWTPDHIRMKNVWEALNQGYARANIAMYYIGRFPQNAKTKLEISEARFLRAYYIDLINDLFGQVSYRDTTNLEFISTPQVLNRTEAVSYIVSELKNILPTLPTKEMVAPPKSPKVLYERYLQRFT